MKTGKLILDNKDFLVKFNDYPKDNSFKIYLVNNKQTDSDNITYKIGYLFEHNSEITYKFKNCSLSLDNNELSFETYSLI